MATESLTPRQQEALDKMQPGKWYSPYDLGATIATLNALVRKGHLERKCELGYMAFPRTSTMYRRKQKK